METLELSTAIIIVRAVQDRSNPVASPQSMEKRDKWLQEADLGWLHMEPETRVLLETVTAKHLLI